MSLKKLIAGVMISLFLGFMGGCLSAPEAEGVTRKEDPQTTDGPPPPSEEESPVDSAPSAEVLLQISGAEDISGSLRENLPLHWQEGEGSSFLPRLMVEEETPSSWSRDLLFTGSEDDKDLLSGLQGQVPLTWSAWGFFYSRSLFDRYGWTEPGTWKEFTTLLEDLRIRGLQPITAAGSNSRSSEAWFIHLGLRLGGTDKMTQLMKGDIPFSDGFVKLILNYWRPVILRYMDRASADYTRREAWRAVAEERAGILLCSSAGLSLLSEEERRNIGFFPFPRMSGAFEPVVAVEPTRVISWRWEGAAPVEDLQETAASWMTSSLDDFSQKLNYGVFSSSSSSSSFEVNPPENGEEPPAPAGPSLDREGWGLNPVVYLKPAARRELNRLAQLYYRRNFQIIDDFSGIEN